MCPYISGSLRQGRGPYYPRRKAPTWTSNTFLWLDGSIMQSRGPFRSITWALLFMTCFRCKRIRPSIRCERRATTNPTIKGKERRPQSHLPPRRRLMFTFGKAQRRGHQIVTNTPHTFLCTFVISQMWNRSSWQFIKPLKFGLWISSLASQWATHASTTTFFFLTFDSVMYRKWKGGTPKGDALSEDRTDICFDYSQSRMTSLAKFPCKSQRNLEILC